MYIYIYIYNENVNLLHCSFLEKNFIIYSKSYCDVIAFKQNRVALKHGRLRSLNKILIYHWIIFPKYFFIIFYFEETKFLFLDDICDDKSAILLSVHAHALSCTCLHVCTCVCVCVIYKDKGQRSMYVSNHYKQYYIIWLQNMVNHRWNYLRNTETERLTSRKRRVFSFV